MKAIQPQQFNRPRKPTGDRGVSGSAIPVSIISIPLLAGVAGLAGATGILPGLSPSVWFSLSFVLACGAMAGIAFRLESHLRQLRRPETSNVEMLGTPRAFIERLEELTRESRNVCVLDCSRLTRHLAAAPRFMNAQYAPRSRYRQISTVGDPEEFRSLVRLIRRSTQAERGSYFAAQDDPLVSVSTSFCVVERDDGLYTFLIYEIGCRKRANVVLFHDDVFGRRMLGEFDRLWSRLAANGPPLFDDGVLNHAVEARLRAAWTDSKAAAPRRLRAA